MTSRSTSSIFASIRAKAIDLAIPPVLAAMFWAVIVLLVIFATAEGKDSPFTAFFTAAGAAGQVFFAWMVWRLSQQQFNFTQRVARRQARIDTFAHRVDLFDRFVEVQKRLGAKSISEEAVDDLFDLAVEFERLFSRATNDAFEAYSVAAGDMVDLIESEANAAAGGDTQGVTDLKAARLKASRELRDFRQRAYSAARDELRLDVE